LRSLIDSLASTPIADLAASFCDLQEARHRADYDHLASFSKAVAFAHIEDAEKAMETLNCASPREREALFAVLAVSTRLN
jgi:hypothetical protein